MEPGEINKKKLIAACVAYADGRAANESSQKRENLIKIMIEQLSACLLGTCECAGNSLGQTDRQCAGSKSCLLVCLFDFYLFSFSYAAAYFGQIAS